METILVAGVDTVVGANLAAMLSETHRVVGLAATPVTIADCEISVGLPADAAGVREWIAKTGPSQVVYCGPASVSCWETEEHQSLPANTVALAGYWADAANKAGCRLTVISSDAVFTGPWMFHKENSTSLCPSAEATTLRAMEEGVLEICPSALIVRTNAFGWSPARDGGWLGRTMASIASRNGASLDCLRHSTPILATDVVDVLLKAWETGLDGIYHIAGAERINPTRFVECLAEEFDLPMPLRCRVEPLLSRPEGFGCGETSLHTKKIRKALFVAMPTVREGLQRLHAQKLNNFMDRFGSPNPRPVHSRVA